MKACVVGLLVVGVLATSLGVPAQQARRAPYRVGILHLAFGAVTPNVEGLKTGLKAAGLEEGRDVLFDVRFTRGQIQSLPQAVRSLVEARPDLLFTTGEEATRASMAATRSIPVVFIGVGDPVAAKIVASLSHPGGNVTGVSGLTTELASKRLEILKALVPALHRVWAVYHADDAMSAAAARQAASVASSVGLVVMLRPVRSEEEVRNTLKAIPAGDGLFAPYNVYLDVPGLMLIASLSIGLPAIYPSAFWVRAAVPGIPERGLGALASYGSDYRAEASQAGRLVAKILRGAKPQDIPVEAVTRVEFVINLKTAKALRLTIPPSVLVRADEVIE